MCIPQDRLQVHGLAFHYLYGFYKLMAHDGFLLNFLNFDILNITANLTNVFRKYNKSRQTKRLDGGYLRVDVFGENRGTDPASSAGGNGGTKC